MSLTSLATFAPGDTIPSAWANLIRDNFLAIDARTGGDPGGTGKFLMGNGAAAGAWVAAATALDDRVAVAGDTMTADLKFASGFGVQLGPNSDDGRLYDVDGALSLLRANNHAFAVYTSNLLAEVFYAGFDGACRFMGNTVITTANDGTLCNAASAGNADTVDGAHASATPTASTIPIANGSGKIANGWLNTGGAGGIDADTVDTIQGNDIVIKSPSGAQTIANTGGNFTVNGPSGSQLILTNSIPGGYPWSGTVGAFIAGNLQVTGAKSRIATGADEQQAALYSTEAPIPYFEDFGRAEVDGDAAWVEIPADFRNYVDTTRPYFVQVTPEGPASLYVTDMGPDRFLVHRLGGPLPVSFSYRIVARQGDLTHVERALPFGDGPTRPDPGGEE